MATPVSTGISARMKRVPDSGTQFIREHAMHTLVNVTLLCPREVLLQDMETLWGFIYEELPGKSPTNSLNVQPSVRRGLSIGGYGLPRGVLLEDLPALLERVPVLLPAVLLDLQRQVENLSRGEQRPCERSIFGWVKTYPSLHVIL